MTIKKTIPFPKPSPLSAFKRLASEALPASSSTSGPVIQQVLGCLLRIEALLKKTA